jgi:tetratricopeptide (TPR) repeat protein
MINLDFSTYVLDRTCDFTGREWVFKAINDWLADRDGSRFFLLKGEPGSGKTAISARLSQFSQGLPPPNGLSYLTRGYLSAIHFCSARDTTWIDPLVFAGSLATQLANRYPAYLKLLEDLQQEKHIGIEVQQTVQEVVNGQVIGVVINVSGPSPESAFNRVVREPLKALLDGGMSEQVVILVDALDEALSYSGTPTIVSLLAKTDQLSPQVRFLLTTRQEERVENQFLEVKELSLAIPGDQRNQDDIRRYVEGRLQNDLQLTEKAAQVETTQVTELIETVPRKAEGNFLYIRFLLDAMAKGLRPLTELDGLPLGLDWLYFDSLRRVVDLGKRDWFNEYRPLMGVLSVAQESLTLAQLQSFTNQSESSCREYRRNLEQFIEEVKPQGEQVTKYRLYHQSVMDFLHRKVVSIKEKEGERKLDNIFYLPTDEWHKQMANVCEQDNLSIIWEDLKRNPVEQGRRQYARKYYITHLYQAQEWQRLFSALDASSYGQAKIRYDPSMHTFAQDLGLGQQATMWEGWTIDKGMALLPRLWQYTLLHCSLTSRVDRYPEEAFRLLVLLGRKQEALGLAELLTDPIKKVRVLVHIALQLREQASQDSEWLELLMNAGEVSHTIKDRSWESSAQASALRDLGTALAQAQQWTEAERVISTIKSHSAQASALSALGTALAQAQQMEQASQVWTEAKRVISTIKDSSVQASALSALGTALAQAQQMEQASQVWTEAERVISTIKDSSAQASALSALAQAQQWTEVKRVISTIKDNFWQASALSALGTALAQAQQWTEAERFISTIKVSSSQASVLSALDTALAQAQEAKRVISTIKVSSSQASALSAMDTALAQAQQWSEAERVISTIKDSSAQADALRSLATLIAQTDKLEQLMHLIQHAWQQAKTREEALALFSIASSVISRKPEIGILFIAAFSWVNKFLGG